MVEETHLILIVLLMMAVTLLPRTLPMQINTERWPAFLTRTLEFLPVSIVAAITLAPLLVNDQRLALMRPEVFAALPTLLCAYFSKNLLLSVAVGMAAYIALGTML
ncbi:branched-subunit amino acid transport protein [Pseudomonas duriflava]|uniref:Branched-subunit amino acid transport protein n=1 Tax=Pseudomonas duriflava TaxID=459528 RepID=A0A562QIJ8_9PSED|nr:AzlD domain-containing protein [Pseudomonas duriflava]TWI56535.1 branched-subunit amino acid transport protein [Pseudomonas duriflava]